MMITRVSRNVIEAPFIEILPIGFPPVATSLPSLVRVSVDR